jgi:hypothetical protein
VDPIDEVAQLRKPEHLYKYHSASRAAQILRDCTFYFAPVSQLNDLYEFRARSLYSETALSKYRVLAKRLVCDGWYATLEEAMAVAPALSAADETYRGFIAQLNATLAAVMKHSGFVCFSAARNNQRMWGSYGGGHAGAFIEFYAAAGTSDFAANLMPVIYSNKKLDIDTSEFITLKGTLDQWLCGVFCCIKHSDWRDEREWRLLLLADAPQSQADRTYRFESRAISRVFLGPRISEADETAIREAAGGQTPSIPVFKRSIDSLEAKEEVVGVEQIESREQWDYWVKRFSK